MRCDDARLALSLRADGEVPDVAAAEVDDHLGSCPECRRFAAGIQVLRRALRFEAVDHVPDLGPAVVALLAADPTSPSGPQARPRPRPHPRPPRHLRQGRPHLARPGAGWRWSPRLPPRPGVAGATFVGRGPDPPSPAAADLPDRVVAAQADVTARGRFPDSPGDGGRTLTPSSPTGPPSRSRSREETTAGSRPPRTAASSSTATAGGTTRPGPAPPLPGLVRCPDPDPRWVTAVTGPGAVLPRHTGPLDLVVPVDSFALAAASGGLGTRTVAGHGPSASPLPPARCRAPRRAVVRRSTCAPSIRATRSSCGSTPTTSCRWPWSSRPVTTPPGPRGRRPRAGRSSRATFVTSRRADEMRSTRRAGRTRACPPASLGRATDAGFQGSDGGDLPSRSRRRPSCPPASAPYRAGP